MQRAAPAKARALKFMSRPPQDHGPNHFAGAGLVADEPRRLPSESVAATSSPPREPSFKGWNSTVTLSPGLTVSAFQPPDAPLATPCISNHPPLDLPDQS